MKRIITLFLLVFLLLTSFTACGGYDPEDYVSLPPLSDIVVKNSDVDEALVDTLEDLLIRMTGEHFIPVDGRNEKVRLGDKVFVTYSGRSADPNVTISQATLDKLTATEGDKMYIIPGAGLLPQAVEDILIGTSVGSDVSVDVTYTKDNTDINELIGKEISLSIKVVGISRLTVTKNHAVKLEFKAALADGSEPLEKIKPLLTGAVETVDLTDADDTFNTAFTVEELMPHVLGANKYQTLDFTLTLDAERAARYGYDKAVDIRFEATVKEASDTPAELTDLLIAEETYGEYNTVSDYLAYCRDLIRDDLAMQAISKAATFNDDYPKELYDEYYAENYNEVLYEYFGTSSEITAGQMSSLSAEALEKIEDSAHAGTIAELREHFLLEYLFEKLSITLIDEEYDQMLDELFETFYLTNQYMLMVYGITTPQALEDYLGKDYVEFQLKYEKLVNIIENYVTFID